jgi:hypothetical protein
MGRTCRSQIGILKSSLKLSWCYSFENNKTVLFSAIILYCYYYDASCTNYIFHIHSQDGKHKPTKDRASSRCDFDEYDGDLSNMLCGIL